MMIDESVFENALHPLRSQPIYQYRLFGVLCHGVGNELIEV